MGKRKSHIPKSIIAFINCVVRILLEIFTIKDIVINVRRQFKLEYQV